MSPAKAPRHNGPKDTMDPELRRLVDDAERRDGMRYGGQIMDGVPVFVDVTFYPERRWWIHTANSERQPMSEELKGQIVPLAL